MLRDWRSELNRFLVLIAVTTVVGLIAGRLTLFLLVGILGYLAHTFYQLHRLYSWLDKLPETEQDEPPEAKGIWGSVFDGIYRLQRREREAVNHLKSILNKAQESSAALEMAVIMINRKGNLEWWNKAAETLLGFRSEQDQQQGVTNLLREPRFFEYFESGKYNEPLQIPSPLNKKIILEFQVTLFGEGERLMLVRDVTQMHKLELMRKDFVGNVSHELRTPITVINGYLETLLDNRDSVAPRWIKPLEQMLQQSQRMENIVRDLLTLSRLETKALPKQQDRVDISSLLREIRGEAEQVFAAKQHAILLECEGEYFLQGSMSELYSAISNLLFNAGKYTPDHGKIILKANLVTTGLDIEVADNGVGIEEQHLPRLTERFYRVDESRSTDTGGTGLGLAIVKHVLARHGAKLEILSEVGKGSRFICHFPKERLLEAVPPQDVRASA
ncbi:MAG: phosphate regulon sensor histidine kinase PhoR [Gammaproteobacteria bacterium]|nr:phosphate regulon sensor histidine kinase PhoR [Gammaproteobacteria bacterium]MDP2139453.1 phosphate regulon sensor histidine kinase PhoR [Gammaproteobacteria bacterium]MDP2346289.1 phosphate regulon sensor histidine kinase PhoR [Gammaproteobacteria bacterium]